MWVRKRLDIGWSDLAFGLAALLFRFDAARIARRIEASWSTDRGAIVCLSVRSGFDLLLSALQFPPGSEVLISALTIPDMVRIIEEHGLIAVPVDLDLPTAGPTVESLERAVSSTTRAVLVAHLFGGRLPLEPIAEFARAHNNLVLIEDCAQAFEGDGWLGSDCADVSMFSFGTIKTATALGGGLLRVREAQVLERMRSLHAAWSLQSSGAFLRRVLKYSLLKLLSGRIAYGCLMRTAQMCGIDVDRRMNRAVRGFVGPDFSRRIRQRPCAGLLALLERRLSQPRAPQIASRRRCGERLAQRLGTDVDCAGAAVEHHSHWVFPVCVPDPAGLMEALRDAGFDATQGESLCVVAPPSNRPQLDPYAARGLLAGCVYLPCYSELPESELERMTAVLRRALTHKSLPGLEVVR